MVEFGTNFTYPLITSTVTSNTESIQHITGEQGVEIEMGEQEVEMNNYIEVEDDEVEILDEEAEISGQEAENDNINGSLYGMTRKTVQEMYELYCHHAREIEFSVRKTTTRKSTKGVELAKLYVCSCAGMRRTNTIGTIKKRNIGITRTDCKALMSVKLNDKGVYEVVKHRMEHNHQLTRKEWSHYHRSERNITAEKEMVIDQMISSGMKAAESYHYLAYQAGGEQNVGHTLRDHMNFVAQSNLNKIESGDAQTFLDMIQAENSENQKFFYSVKLDDKARLSNIFWRDSIMKEDYLICGDVVVFDTTYRTNKYNLVCAPFVGINNHMKNVMFGCAFISDEKSETFEWLFKQFRKSMGDKYPITIFTYQDLAIANGIGKVFPETKHWLCLWHLKQNAIAKFGNLKSDDTFKDTFNKCLSDCVDANEFETCWNSMIATYGLQSNTWFTRMYGLKDKWCTALNKHYFSAGIVSSQRSESTNHSIGCKVRKDTNLTLFYKYFKETVKNWRITEVKDEVNCTKTELETFLEKKGLIKHAMEVYTATLFRDFEKEFIKSFNASFRILLVEDTTYTYDVASGKEASERVIFDCHFKLIKCSCMRFEETGMLCYHCVRILNINSVEMIPNAYILKKWSKFAKTGVWDKILNHEVDAGKATTAAGQWKHDMSRNYNILLLLSEGNEAARRTLEEGYIRDKTTINSLISAEQVEDVASKSTSSTTVLDPTRSTTKGRSKIIKGHF